MNEPPHEEDASTGEGYYAEEAQPYDPGAALQDENAYYGAADPGQQVYYDPNQQAYYDPNQEVYYDPAQVAPDGGGYEEPVQETAPPAPLPVVPTVKKKAAAKKRPQVKTGKSAAAKRPAGRPRPKPVRYDGEGISLMTILLAVVALGLVVFAVYVAMPKDMSAVGGYAVDPAAGEPRNLLAEVQTAMIDRSSELTFTEEEVNRYLNHRLEGAQKGLLSTFVKFRGVYIDFEPGKAEVVVEREIFGMPLTISSKLASDRFREQIVYKLEGWSLGKIQLGVRNAKPIVDLFIRLRNSLLDEYQAISQMSDVRFEANQVVLNSRM